MEDKINPTHYKSMCTCRKCGSSIETIELTKQYNFALGNALKYIIRAGKKDGASALEDLAKALWYVKHEIAELSTKPINIETAINSRSYQALNVDVINERMKAHLKSNEGDDND